MTPRPPHRALKDDVSMMIPHYKPHGRGPQSFELSLSVPLTWKKVPNYCSNHRYYYCVCGRNTPFNSIAITILYTAVRYR